MPPTKHPSQPDYDQCFHCTLTQEFRDSVTKSLSELNSSQKVLDANQRGTNERLDRVNGNVAELFRRTNDHSAKFAGIDAGGGEPLREVRESVRAVSEMVTALDKKFCEQMAATKGAKGVIRELHPLIWMLITAILLTLVRHADDWMGALHKVAG